MDLQRFLPLRGWASRVKTRPALRPDFRTLRPPYALTTLILPNIYRPPSRPDGTLRLFRVYPPGPSRYYRLVIQ